MRDLFSGNFAMTGHFAVCRYRYMTFRRFLFHFCIILWIKHVLRQIDFVLVIHGLFLFATLLQHTALDFTLLPRRLRSATVCIIFLGAI